MLLMGGCTLAGIGAIQAALGQPKAALSSLSEALKIDREIGNKKDAAATLVDLAASPGGVFLRLRAQQSLELQAGDLIQLGDQVLRLELG